jgi:hypothetical protein
MTPAASGVHPEQCQRVGECGCAKMGLELASFASKIKGRLNHG